MTVRELIEQLQDFGDHLKVIVEVEETDRDWDIDYVETTQCDGETVCCVYVAPAENIIETDD